MAADHVAGWALKRMRRGFALIIFDCDGVLVDSELLSCRCLAEALTEEGLPVSRDEVLDLFLGRSLASIVAHYASLGRSLSRGFEAKLRSRIRQAFAEGLRPIPDIAQVLPRLGASFCVASSSDTDRVAHSLELTGLKALFGTRIFTAQMVARGKPAPDLFLHAAAAMRVAPKDTLVVEDSASGVRAGKAAGMTVWGFVGGSHHASSHRRLSLESAGADRVFDQMTELLGLEVDEARGSGG